MEIEEFIEQDILIFLDDALDKMQSPTRPERAQALPLLYLTRDYEKELFAALDKQDMVAAKKVLHDLKAQFDEAPSGTPDKEQLKTLLITLYDKFKENIDAQNMFHKLDPALAPEQTNVLLANPAATPRLPEVPQPPADPLLQATEPAPPQPPGKPADTAATVTQQSMPSTQIAPPQETAGPSADIITINAHLDEAERLVSHNDLEEAVRTYKRAKQAAAAVNALPADIVLRFRTTFATIKGALSQMAAEQQEALPQLPTQSSSQTKKPIPRDEPFTLSARDLDKQTLLQLEQEKHKLDVLLKRNDLLGGVQQYRRMRVIAQHLNDPKLAQSTTHKLQRIYSILEEMRQHAVHNERKLMAVP